MPGEPVNYASPITEIAAYLDGLMAADVRPGFLAEDAALPSVSIIRSGGGPQSGDPADNALIEALIITANRDWAQAEQIAMQVATELTNAASVTLPSGARLRSATVLNITTLETDLVDPSFAGFSVTAEVVVTN